MDVRLEPWSEDDLDLLRQINTPEMKKHLGGPETDEQVIARNQRYTAMNDPATGRMFRVVLLPEKEAVGGIGYWEREWEGDQVYETGWSVLPGYQGRGIAVAAARAVIEVAREQHRHRYLHAYPNVDNAASNAICRKAGFDLLGPCDFEYPPGHPMRCNDWRLDLAAAAG
jgi:RimJ/RimL family protein N-acetyltransferase